MKHKLFSRKSESSWNRVLISAAVLICLFGGIPSARVIAEPPAQTNRWENDDPVKEIKLLNEDILAKRPAIIDFYSKLVDRYERRQSQLTWNLLQIFNDQTASVAARGCAANYLGEVRSEAAAGGLASGIAFRFVPEGVHFRDIDIPDIQEFPAQQALIKIGIASIPALIGNLAQSDDAQIRKLSLEAIYRIEGDKDIVQIRLQKAAKAETDPKKQARLQAALKALDETKF